MERQVLLADFPNKPFLVAIDFDDTICWKGFPTIENGTLMLNTVAKMAQTLKEHPNAEFILWTCRQGERLEESKGFCKKHKLPIKYFNEQHPFVLKAIPESKHWRKILADEYWDDKAVRITQKGAE